MVSGTLIYSFTSFKEKFKFQRPSFALIFSAEDGLWNFNFSLNDVKEFTEDMTIGEAYQLIYQFLFKLMEAIEEK